MSEDDMFMTLSPAMKLTAILYKTEYLSAVVLILTTPFGKRFDNITVHIIYVLLIILNERMEYI